MARIIPDPRRVASAWRARRAWNTAAAQVQPGSTVTVRYESPGWDWAVTGKVRIDDGVLDLVSRTTITDAYGRQIPATIASENLHVAGVHFVQHTRRTWPRVGTYVLHETDLHPLRNRESLPSPVESITHLGHGVDVRVWWYDEDTDTRFYARGRLRQGMDGEISVGPSEEDRIVVPLDLVTHACVDRAQEWGVFS